MFPKLCQSQYFIKYTPVKKFLGHSNQTKTANLFISSNLPSPLFVSMFSGFKPLTVKRNFQVEVKSQETEIDM